MPMNESTARGVALLLYDDPLAQVIELKAIRHDIYRVRFTDRRDGRTHTVLELSQVADWIDSVFEGRVLHPAYGVCEVCDWPPRRARRPRRAAQRVPGLPSRAARQRDRG